MASPENKLGDRDDGIDSNDPDGKGFADTAENTFDTLLGFYLPESPMAALNDDAATNTAAQTHGRLVDAVSSTRANTDSDGITNPVSPESKEKSVFSLSTEKERLEAFLSFYQAHPELYRIQPRSITLFARSHQEVLVGFSPFLTGDGGEIEEALQALQKVITSSRDSGVERDLQKAESLKLFSLAEDFQFDFSSFKSFRPHHVRPISQIQVTLSW